MIATETIHEIKRLISAISKNLLSVAANACRGQIYKTGGLRVQYFFAYDGHIDIYTKKGRRQQDWQSGPGERRRTGVEKIERQQQVETSFA